MEKLVVRSSALEKLERLSGRPSASIHLVAKKHDHFGLEALAAALRELGAALGALDMSLAFPQHPFSHDLRDLDFAAACPHLETLSLGRCRLNASVLLHPTLKKVTLENCWLYTSDPLRLGYPDSPCPQVTTLHLSGVNWGNPDEGYLGQLAFGPGAALKEFIYYGDEDDIELYPEIVVFDGCSDLSDVVVHVCGGWWLKLQGDLPRLDTFAASSGRYGPHRLSLDGIGDGSSAFALSLRDGQGPFTGQQFLFAGQFRHLANLLAGAEAALLPLGVQSTLTDVVSYTFAYEGGDEYLVALWEDDFATNEIEPGTSLTLSIGGLTETLHLPAHSGLSVTGYDVLHNFRQTMDACVEGNSLVIPGLQVRDYPLVLKLTQTNRVLLPIILKGRH